MTPSKSRFNEGPETSNSLPIEVITSSNNDSSSDRAASVLQSCSKVQEQLLPPGLIKMNSPNVNTGA